ncbi:hypothetical protein LB504_007058 [Fusarium proliferatum]|nr:hypothetical protein LB504_007058 [Fusarium proliferatum]
MTYYYTDDNDICLLVITAPGPRDSNTEHEIHHKSYHYLKNYTCCVKPEQSRFRVATAPEIFCMCDTALPKVFTCMTPVSTHHHQSLLID